MFPMKNITVRTSRALGAVVKARRLELGWSQAKLAEELRVQRQWVIRLESGTEGAEIGTVLKALVALGLSITVGNEPDTPRSSVAPTASLDEVFARVTRTPLPVPGLDVRPRAKKARKARG